MLKPHYSRFIGANPGRLHFGAHSHHLWPDVTRRAVIDCWEDAARLVDRKWDEAVFSRVVPAAQDHVARTVGLSRSEQVAFAPNTHELVTRLLSCFAADRPLRVLTTDGEFMSFDRQLRRLEERAGVTVTRVAVEPFESFDERYRDAAASGEWDLVFFSHVFFASGWVVEDLAGIVSAAPPDAVVVVDGYHSFGAIPFSFRPLERRAFYVAGGYKYAQSGEGACFMAVPHGCRLRPADTGWFASFGALPQPSAREVAYSDDGFRFWGATFDPTPLYRFNAVMGWLRDQGVGVAEVHRHARGLQERFLQGLEERRPARLSAASLVTPRDLARQGHFLAFRVADAAALAADLRGAGVDVDYRAELIRFGFGVYQEAPDVDELIARLERL